MPEPNPLLGGDPSAAFDAAVRGLVPDLDSWGVVDTRDGGVELAVIRRGGLEHTVTAPSRAGLLAALRAELGTRGDEPRSDVDPPVLGLDDESYARARGHVLTIVKAMAGAGLDPDVLDALVVTAEEAHAKTRDTAKRMRSAGGAVDLGVVARLDQQAAALDLELGMFRGAARFARVVAGARTKAQNLAAQGPLRYDVDRDPRGGTPPDNGA